MKIEAVKDKSLFYMLVFILVLGTISSGVLFTVARKMAPIIKKQKAMASETAILNAFDISYNKSNIVDIFRKNVRSRSAGDMTIYNSTGGLRAIELEGSGLWDVIRIVVSFNSSLTKIHRVVIIYQEETPGLGGRITEPKFLAQFKGKDITNGIRIVKRVRNPVNEVNAITGATLTSKALEKIINTGIKGIKRMTNVD